MAIENVREKTSCEWIYNLPKHNVALIGEILRKIENSEN